MSSKRSDKRSSEELSRNEIKDEKFRCCSENIVVVVVVVKSFDVNVVVVKSFDVNVVVVVVVVKSFEGISK